MVNPYEVQNLLKKMGVPHKIWNSKLPDAETHQQVTVYHLVLKGDTGVMKLLIPESAMAKILATEAWGEWDDRELSKDETDIVNLVNSRLNQVVKDIEHLKKHYVPMGNYETLEREIEYLKRQVNQRDGREPGINQRLEAIEETLMDLTEDKQ